MPQNMIDRLAQVVRSALPAEAFVSRTQARHVARQLLVSLRDPTNEMLEVGAAFFDLPEHDAKKAAALIFSDMLGAALSPDDG